MRKKVVRALLGMACAISCLFSSTMALSYRPDLAIAYSDRCALNPDSGYHYYDGADCTNYVSQCVNSGRLPRDGTWYTNKGTDGKLYGSTAWVNANAFKNYISKRAVKIGSWQKNATISGFYSYTNNSSNLTNTNKGKTIIYYDWDGDWTINHSALFVVNNSKTFHPTKDGNVTGDLTNQHSNNLKHVIWNADKRNARRSTTKIYAF